MKKKLTLIALSSFLSFSALNAHAEGIANPFTENGEAVKYYLGAGIGAGRQGGTCEENFINDATCEDSGISYKVFGGARLNPMFAVEGGYRKFNDTKISGTDGSGNPTSLEKSISGYDLEAVAFFPVSQEIELFGKAGLMKWNQDTVKKETIQTSNDSETSVSLLLGGGAEYKMNDNIKLRGEWERVFKTGGTNSSETDIDMITAGITFSAF